MRRCKIGSGGKKPTRKEYAKAVKWWEMYQAAVMKETGALPSLPPPPIYGAPCWAEWHAAYMAYGPAASALQAANAATVMAVVMASVYAVKLAALRDCLEDQNPQPV